MPLAIHLGIPLATFALVTLVAQLAGATNLGTAMGIGQLAFVAALAYVLLRRPPRSE